MDRFLVVSLLLGLIATACGGDDGDEATPVPASPSATASEATASATAEASTPVPPPPPTATPSPVEAAGCGEPLLAEGNPAREELAALEGRLVFSCGGQIWMANPDGSGQTQLTEAQDFDWDAISVYITTSDGNPPSRQQREELEAQINSLPRWLADGRIAFASIRDTLALSTNAPAGMSRVFHGATEVYVINADGTGEERLTEFNLVPGSYSSPFREFAPAIDCVAPGLCSAGLLTVRPFAGAHTQSVLAVAVVEIRMTECCFLFGLLDLTVAPAALDFTPFGEARFVGQDWSSDDQVTLSTVQLWEGLSAVDTEFRLEPGGATHSFPAFTNGGSLSPDGTTVVYCGFASRPGPWSVRLARPSSGDSRVLLTVEDNLATRTCQPRWSPDGSHVVLNDGEGRVVVVEVETGTATPVANGLAPDWGP